MKVTWTGPAGVIGTTVVTKMFAFGTDTTGTEWHLHSGEKIKGASFKGNTIGFVLTTTDPDYYANCPAHPDAPGDTDVTGYISTIVPQ